MAESSLPISDDLNLPTVRDRLGLEFPDKARVEFAGIQKRDGDDASCLNMNLVSHPALLGVDPEVFARRKSFTVVELADKSAQSNPWPVLDQDTAPDVIPAFVDQTVLQWGLRKRLGDTIDYVDEQGRTTHLLLVGALANSVFQGNLIISRKQMARHFPTVSGYRIWLVDVQGMPPIEAEKTLAEFLRDTGTAIIPAAEQLARFNQVENTYLSIFLILGGLGLVLGSAGLGLITVRNILDRRAELGLFLALGFRHRTLQKLLVGEHAGLWLMGLACGAGSALIALIPALNQGPHQNPLFDIVLLAILLLTNGLFWTILATAMALKGPLLDHLRPE
jgi:hypothetical protein